MKKKFFAVALATTMALSTVMTASAETLTGTAWWTGMQAGQNYTLTGDGTLTLSIEVKAAAESGKAAFSFEATNGDTYFLTTGSDGNIWFADSANNNAPITGSSVSKNQFADAGNEVAG